MKKLFKGLMMSSFAVALLFGATACGTTEKKADNTTASQDTNKKEDALHKTQVDLTNYEIQLEDLISEGYQPYASLESLTSGTEFDAAAVKTAADTAANEAADFSKKVDQLALPATLSDEQKQNIKKSLESLKASFNKRSEAAKAAEDAKSLDDLNKVVTDMSEKALPDFEAFEKAFNDVLKGVELFEGNFQKLLS